MLSAHLACSYRYLTDTWKYHCPWPWTALKCCKQFPFPRLTFCYRYWYQWQMFGGAMMPANCAILQITKTNKNPSTTRAPHRPIMTTLCLVAVAVACCYKVLPPNQLLSVLSFSYYFRSSHIFITARDLLNINIFWSGDSGKFISNTPPLQAWSNGGRGAWCLTNGVFIF